MFVTCLTCKSCQIDRADAAGGDDVSIGHQNELVQAREKRFVLERVLHERIDFQLAAGESKFVIARRRSSAQRWGMLLERILKKAGIPR